MYRIGVDIGGTKIHTALFDRAGTVHHEQRIPSHSTLAGAPGAALAKSLREFLRQAGIEAVQVEAIVIGIPGIQNVRTGVIIDCPNLTVLNGVPLAAEVQAALGIPTLMEKDVNLIGLSEQAVGHGVGVDDFACLFVGSGLGCALILRGELYQGADGVSGEFGHIPIEPNGLRCTCGGVGCLEMYCSGKALTVRAGEILPGRAFDMNAYPDAPWTVAQEVIEAAHAGHPAAVKALEDSFFYLGVGVVSLVSLLNLRMIILGGGIINGYPGGIDIVRRVLAERGRGGVREQVHIERSTLSDLPHLAGAGVLIDRHLARK